MQIIGFISPFRFQQPLATIHCKHKNNKHIVHTNENDSEIRNIELQTECFFFTIGFRTYAFSLAFCYSYLFNRGVCI